MGLFSIRMWLVFSGFRSFWQTDLECFAVFFTLLMHCSGARELWPENPIMRWSHLTNAWFLFVFNRIFSDPQKKLNPLIELMLQFQKIIERHWNCWCQRRGALEGGRHEGGGVLAWKNTEPWDSGSKIIVQFFLWIIQQKRIFNLWNLTTFENLIGSQLLCSERETKREETRCV